MRSLLLLVLCVVLPAINSAAQDSIAWHNGGAGINYITIKKIVIEGNKVTRSKVILRELGIREGDVIRKDSVQGYVDQVRLRVYNLQLFNEVNQVVEIDDAGNAEWHIQVKERWYILPSVTVQFADRNFNTWFVQENHDLRRAMVGVTLTDKNFRGNLDVLAVTVQAGYTQKLGLSYMIPYLNSSQTKGLGLNMSMSQSRQAWYYTDSNKLRYAGLYTGPVVLRQWEAGVSYIYRPAYRSRHIVQAGYRDYEVSDTLLKLNADYYGNKRNRARFMELDYRYEYNGVDNWNYSLQGVKVVANATVRKGIEGIDFQSFGVLEAGYFKRLGAGWYASGILRGRLMLPEDQPYFFRGGLGTQTDYVRGYEYYIVDGGNYGLVRFDLKRQLLNKMWSFPLKYFTTIPLRVYPKVFADAGYINSPVPGNSFLSNKILWSAGVGVDIVTLYDVKIRVELARNHLGQNGVYLHFNSE